MSASHFMDKQIMGLSGPAAQGGDLLGQLNAGGAPRSNGAGAAMGEEILPSYDFQPIRRAGSPPVGLDGRGDWASAGSMPSSSDFRNYGSLEAHEPPRIILGKSKETYDTASVAEIDRIVKKYSDILLHTLEGVNSRLSQLEGRSRSLESAVDELKLSIDDSSGSADGKLRQLENVLSEVQVSLEVLRDKQQIAEAQMQLAKLQTSKGDQQQPDNSNIVLSNSQQSNMPLPQQSLQQPAQPSVAPPPPPPPFQIPVLPAPSVPNAPPPLLPQQQNPPPAQFSSQGLQHQGSSISSMLPREPYFPSPGQPTAEAHQQHYQPPTQQTQVPLSQHYPPAPQLAQYSQLPQPTQPVGPPQLQPSLPHHHEESSPYMPPSQTYPPSIHQPPQLQTGPSPQQIYGTTTNIYEPPASRPASGQPPFPTGYGTPLGPSLSDPYPYSGSPSSYSLAREPSPFSPSSAPSSGSSYPRLPTAQILPQTVPTRSGSGGTTGNRVPVDDVVDKVTTMGFSRDLARETVRKLTENGQSVDLNMVLDKLMNDGENQPRKGWFGR